MRAVGVVVVLKSSEAVDDLLDGRVTVHIFHGEDIDLGKSIQVLAHCGVPTIALVGTVAEYVAARLVQALVQGGFETSSSMVERT